MDYTTLGTHGNHKQAFEMNVVIHQQHGLTSVGGDFTFHSPVHIRLDGANHIMAFVVSPSW